MPFKKQKKKKKKQTLKTESKFGIKYPISSSYAIKNK